MEDYEIYPYKENETDRTTWYDTPDIIGEHLFSIDDGPVYNLFADYPHNMSSEEIAIFDSENPYWADFFEDRKK